METRYIDYNYRLMAPGPVQISQDILQTLAQPMIHHRTPEFVEILNSCLEGLKFFFQTQQPVMMIPSTGSGGMEAAVVNCFSPQDQVIAVVAGKFGQRWADLANTYGLNVHVIDVPWGEAVDVKKIEELLNNNSEIRGVLFQACETSTATWQPVQEIASLCKKHDCLSVVDGITAVGCSLMPFDSWGIDVMVAGSQKAFALPTGLSMVCLSEKAWKANATAKCPRYYFNLLKEKQSNEIGQTFFSSSVSLIRALDIYLKTLREEGLEALVRRTQNLSRCTQRAAVALGLEVYSKSPSPAVTAIRLPETIDGVKLRSHMEEKYKVTVMGGQDQLKGKIVRIGHMGDISNLDQLCTIEALGLSLIDLGFALEPKKLSEALDATDDFLKICSNV